MNRLTKTESKLIISDDLAGAITAEMGHTSEKTTEGYAKIVDRVKENPAGYLESLLAESVR